MVDPDEESTAPEPLEVEAPESDTAEFSQNDDDAITFDALKSDDD